MLQYQIENVGRVYEDTERTVTIVAVDKLRGEIEITLPEQEARWLAASLCPMYNRWLRDDENAEIDAERSARNAK